MIAAIIKITKNAISIQGIGTPTSTHVVDILAYNRYFVINFVKFFDGMSNIDKICKLDTIITKTKVC